MTSIAFPSENDLSVIHPPADPKPGSFYLDEVEGLIYIPEEYDTNGLPMKTYLSGEGCAIVIEGEDNRLGAHSIGWMGLITTDQVKKVYGSVEISAAKLPELRMMGAIDKITVVLRGEAILFKGVELLLSEYTDILLEEDSFLPIQFVAEDDPVLRKQSTPISHYTSTTYLTDADPED